jgi:hypothetical protein
LPNVSNPKELGQLESFGDSANVMWKDGRHRDDVYVRDNESSPWYLSARYEHPGSAKYQLNEEESRYILKDNATGIVFLSSQTPHFDNEYNSEGDLILDIPSSSGTEQISEGFVSQVDATTTLTQSAGSDGIVTGKTLRATDTLTTKVNIEGKPFTFTHYLGEGGKYSSDASGISR